MKDILLYLKSLDDSKKETHEVKRLVYCVLHAIGQRGRAQLNYIACMFFAGEQEGEESSGDDLTRLLKSKAYCILRSNGMLRQRISAGQENCIVFDEEDRFIPGSVAFDTLKALAKPTVANNENKPACVPKPLVFEGTTVTSSDKTVLTPIGRLQRRIDRNIRKATYLGDIAISEEEYTLLLQTARKYLARIFEDKENLVSPLVCVALVQIGIHCYLGGDYWGNLANELEIEPLTGSQQRAVGQLFVRTMKHFGKSILKEHEYVSNIMMHTYVCSHYASNYFDFLFRYYDLDLDRDLSRLNADEMSALIETIKEKSGADRSYLLAQQTCSAVLVNPRGARIRIRRHLQTIDRLFFDDDIVFTSRNRIYNYLFDWADSSDSFQSGIASRKQGGRRERQFSSPYLSCDLSCRRFYIELPPQIVRLSEPKSVYWQIQTSHRVCNVPTELFSAITGYKTDKARVEIAADELLDKIRISVESESDGILRTFPIAEQDVRFFNQDGIHIQARALQVGGAWAFSTPNNELNSTALLEAFIENGLRVSYLYFEYQDMLRLPRGKMIVIGKKTIEEGFVGKGQLEAAHVVLDDSRYHLYHDLPRLILKLPSHKAEGTLIILNSIRRKLLQWDTVAFQLENTSNEVGYCVTLKKEDFPQNGLYEIIVDSPGEKNKFWRFVYIEGLEAKFDDAPYVLKSRGSIALPDTLVLSYDRNVYRKDKDRNVFMFELKGDQRDAVFTLSLSNQSAELHFTIPALFWRFDDAEWNVGQPIEIWHRAFPSSIELSVPWHKVSVYLDEDDSVENESEENCVEQKPAVVSYRQESRTFFCDTTIFKSYFAGEKIKRTVYIDFASEHIEFLKVITASYVSSCTMSGDYEANVISIQTDLIGGAQYFIDVLYGDLLLIEKALLQNGNYCGEVELMSGKYKVILYEFEPNETGFGIPCLNEIASFESRLVNPYDMRGRTFEILYWYSQDNPSVRPLLGMQYFVKDLEYASSDDFRAYIGKMVVAPKDSQYAKAAYPVHVDFFDLEHLTAVMITFPEDALLNPFIWDTQRRILIKREDPRIKNPEKYRRFVMLDSDADIFCIQFIEQITVIDQFAPSDVPSLEENIHDSLQVRWKSSAKATPSIPTIRNSQLLPAPISSFTQIELQNNGITTIQQLTQLTASDLQYVMKIGRRGIAEIEEMLAVRGLHLKCAATIEAPVSTAHDDSDKDFSSGIASPDSPLLLSVEASGLSPMTYNCLKSSGCLTLGDIVSLLERKGEKGFQSIQKCNLEMRKEIQNVLRRYNLI
jgi:hypothetical protein